MDLWKALDGLKADVSGDITALQAKIRRLQKANSKIAAEQGAGQTEIKAINKPELSASWKGPRADGFDQSRDAAFKDMEKVFNEDYEEYQTQISAKISELQLQADFLSAQQWALERAEDALNAVDDTLDTAKDKLADVGDQLNSIRKGLFS
ncbi:DUF5082 domain-containing protein [Bacillus mangrovi]|uniref:DUF5082 domain-containing protein n=1 Tax=Metabacillus mangrovi TaxID=1491830 RepID=A0A7X2S828_9BACI|nr:DUF5082 family protein [Metabacillus mangrovi]MTH55000.1 DUF5082 domain-containing protein [Metabacillus mangrovi]